MAVEEMAVVVLDVRTSHVVDVRYGVENKGAIDHAASLSAQSHSVRRCSKNCLCKIYSGPGFQVNRKFSGSSVLTFRLPTPYTVCVESNGIELGAVGSGYKIQVLDRTFAILNALSKAESPLPLRRLSEETGLHKSTAHRLLLILERHGYVERTPSRGEYRLGLKLL